MKMTYTTPAARCPACLKTLDGATDPFGGLTPAAGDLSVCLYCTVRLIFNTDLTLRVLRDDEYAALLPEEQLLLAVTRLIAATRGRQP